jgi:hypothetical protein
MTKKKKEKKEKEKETFAPSSSNIIFPQVAWASLTRILTSG